MKQSRRAILRGGIAVCAGIGLERGQALLPTVAAQEPTLRLLASTQIFADIAQNVAGDRAEVQSVTPANADPHTYEASAADLAKVSESDAFIFMGAHLEPFIEAGAWRRAVADAGIPVLELAEHLDLIEVDKIIDHGDHVHDLREGDPHVWLDPLKAVEMTAAIETFLTELDPAGADVYAANAEAYRAELDALHEEFESGLAVIPPERRKLVVFHDAYTYFAERYDFDVIGIVLKSPDGEPSAQEFVELIEIIESENVPVIFAEPQFDTSVLDGIVAETGVEVGELLTDSFAGRVDSYIQLMRYNLESLVTHLG
ncbi:MAG: zinc ABC transporter substrate-binding protein [Thermomicrobiales bacterium]|nr:zinc ABC transporter substrate-binding protein [Thermomicrobiales bacterium]MCO5223124.1 metal ABC transporter substrate-binding protein [Thermomicrobiales bacterium]